MTPSPHSAFLPIPASSPTPCALCLPTAEAQIMFSPNHVQNKEYDPGLTAVLPMPMSSGPEYEPADGSGSDGGWGPVVGV